VWHCKANILSCDPHNICCFMSVECKTYLVNCCIVSWTGLKVLIMFVSQMFNTRVCCFVTISVLLQLSSAVLLLQGTPWQMCFVVE
jgi:hypothetical protein